MMKQNTRCPGNTPMMGGVPVMGSAGPGCTSMPVIGQYETCCQVVEPAITCNPEQHHYHRVDHVVPVMVRNVHHHHNHHNYVINRQETVESYRYDEYLAGPTMVNQPTTYLQPTQTMGQPTMMTQPMMGQQPTVTPQTSVTNQNLFTNQMMGQSLL